MVYDPQRIEQFRRRELAHLYNGERFTSLTTREGLATNEVHEMIQSSDGDFWFATDGGGVSRFDGSLWTTYTTEHGLADNLVSNLFQDQEGNFWFGTWGGGVSRFDGKTILDTGYQLDALLGTLIQYNDRTR